MRGPAERCQAAGNRTDGGSARVLRDLWSHTVIKDLRLSAVPSRLLAGSLVLWPPLDRHPAGTPEDFRSRRLAARPAPATPPTAARRSVRGPTRAVIQPPSQHP